MGVPVRFRQSDVERVLKAAQKCGFASVRVRIDGAGNIEATMGEAVNDESPPVELE